ncbi:MAG: hypothetical protein LBH05_07370 [Deferribacteraceae bacterium]|jgi:hypothetical protein|nr:hypothetical protein [Deferribacteraceae bacterium]
MLTNFDLIWIHTKKLAEKMISSRENLMSEELYASYSSSFEQLMLIAENEPDTVSEEKLSDMLIAAKSLEAAFAAEQERLQDSINAERLKIRAQNAYSTAKIFNVSGYSKTT